MTVGSKRGKGAINGCSIMGGVVVAVVVVVIVAGVSKESECAQSMCVCVCGPTATGRQAERATEVVYLVLGGAANGCTGRKQRECGGQ